MAAWVGPASAGDCDFRGGHESLARQVPCAIKGPAVKQQARKRGNPILPATTTMLSVSKGCSIALVATCNR
jgi:hypothetical protein